MKNLKTVIAFFCFFLIVNVQAQTVSELNNYNDRPSRWRGVIEKFREDYGSLNRFYTAQTSPNRTVRFKQLYSEWLVFLNKQNFDALNTDEQVDYLLFKNYLGHELKEQSRYAKQYEEMSPMIPFAKTISDLEDSRRKLETVDSAKIAALLNDLNKQITATQKNIEENRIAKPKKTVANRTARAVNSLRTTLKNWFAFYNSYDPMFTWWNSEPYKAVDASLQSYQTFLLDKLVGIKADDKTTIIGDPIGRDALLQELEYEISSAGNSRRNTRRRFIHHHRRPRQRPYFSRFRPHTRIRAASRL
jgi:hypothetical protein